jgi:xanthine dehydrogenase YagT iron-sulfur-binding subunit
MIVTGSSESQSKRSEVFMSKIENRGVPAQEEKRDGVNRRSFLSRLGAAGAAVTASPFLGHARPSEPDNQEASTALPNLVSVILNVNGKEHRVRIDARTTLLDCLRETLHLTGAKKGCDHGQCGACTVHINGRRVNSCLTFAAMHQNDVITTIEGIGQPGQLHPMQAAFVEHDGYQCGYCTSGQIMSAVALLNEPCGPADDDVKELMSGNICRCGAYLNILAAIQEVRQRMNGRQNASI